MREKDRRKASPAQLPPIWDMGTAFAEIMAKLNRIDVEVRRIQKKLGMKQIYTEGATRGEKS